MAGYVLYNTKGPHRAQRAFFLPAVGIASVFKQLINRELEKVVFEKRRETALVQKSSK